MFSRFWQRSRNGKNFKSRSARSGNHLIQPRLERLEDRLALSGFGPEDGSYVTETWSGMYTAVQANDQHIVAAGNMNPHGPNLIRVERYDTLGEADATYGDGGLATIDPPAEAGYTAAYGWALALQGEKALVAGQFNLNSGSDVGVARLDASGAPDSTFGRGGWTSLSTTGTSTEYADGIGIQSNGDIVVGGKSVQSGTNVAMAASFTPNGAVDRGKGGFGQSVQGKPVGYVQTSFGSALSWFNDIAIQPDDKVVAVGMTLPSMSNLTNFHLVVARYTANGSLDTTFNRAGYSVLTAPASLGSTQGFAVALQGDGKIVVAGDCAGLDGSSDMIVVRYNADGTLDKSFGGTGYVPFDIDGAATVTSEVAYSVAIQPDGKIVVSGRETLQADTSRENVLVGRFNPNGTLDTDFGGSGFKIGAPPIGHSFHTEGMALSGADIIMAGSDYDSSTGEEHPLLMRFFGADATTAASSATDAALMLLLTDSSLTTTKRK